MRKWSRLVSLFTAALVALIWGIRNDHVEASVSSIVPMVIGVLWEFADAKSIDPNDVIERLWPSRRALWRWGAVIALFALATSWGVWDGFIPGELVVIMLVMLGMAPVIAAPYLYFYRRSLAKSKAADDWPSAPGTVELSFMEEVVSVWPAPIVTYVYTVGERTYLSSRVKFGGTGMMHPQAAQQVLADNPTGAAIAVRYNPDNPAEAVLIPGDGTPDRRLLWGAGLSAGALLLGAGAFALMILLGLLDAVLTLIFGHRVLP